jgi:ActR/RegA family two-component response regulator
MNDMNLPSTAFVGRVLVVSNDAIAIEQLTKSMQRFALSPEHCPEVSSALERLNRTKFEAVIVDLRLGGQAGAVLEAARNSPSNEHAVLFTISGSEVEAAEAFKAGSTFVLRRPLSAASIDLSLKAAYGLIVRERRRYFRCPVEVPVAILRTTMPTVHGHTVNVSEGGMSVATVAPLGPGDQVQLQFTLPADEFQFVLESTVCWAKGQRIGLHFLSPQQISKLQEWLSRRLEEGIPQFVRDKFEAVPQDRLLPTAL